MEARLIAWAALSPLFRLAMCALAAYCGDDGNYTDGGDTTTSLLGHGTPGGAGGGLSVLKVAQMSPQWLVPVIRAVWRTLPHPLEQWLLVDVAAGWAAWTTVLIVQHLAEWRYRPRLLVLAPLLLSAGAETVWHAVFAATVAYLESGPDLHAIVTVLWSVVQLALCLASAAGALFLFPLPRKPRLRVPGDGAYPAASRLDTAWMRPVRPTGVSSGLSRAGSSAASISSRHSVAAPMLPMSARFYFPVERVCGDSAVEWLPYGPAVAASALLYGAWCRPFLAYLDRAESPCVRASPLGPFWLPNGQHGPYTSLSVVIVAAHGCREQHGDQMQWLCQALARSGRLVVADTHWHDDQGDTESGSAVSRGTLNVQSILDRLVGIQYAQSADSEADDTTRHFMHALKGRLRLESVTVLGVGSLGASIALQVAAMDRRIHACVAVSGGGDLDAMLQLDTLSDGLPCPTMFFTSGGGSNNGEGGSRRSAQVRQIIANTRNGRLICIDGLRAESLQDTVTADSPMELRCLNSWVSAAPARRWFRNRHTRRRESATQVVLRYMDSWRPVGTKTAPSTPHMSPRVARLRRSSASGDSLPPRHTFSAVTHNTLEAEEWMHSQKVVTTAAPQSSPPDDTGCDYEGVRLDGVGW